MDANRLLRLFREHARRAVAIADEMETRRFRPKGWRWPRRKLIAMGVELDQAVHYATELDCSLTEGGDLPDEWDDDPL